MILFNRVYKSILYIKELVGGAEEKRDWKGITLAILCIILIGSLVALSVLILSPGNIFHTPVQRPCDPGNRCTATPLATLFATIII